MEENQGRLTENIEEPPEVDISKAKYKNLTKKIIVISVIIAPGELVYKVVKYTMSDMLNPELTASWEKGLEMVSSKEIKSDEFMVKLEKYVKDKVQKVKANIYRY